MVEDESYHGLFFDPKVFFYFFGYPWSHDSIYYCFGFENIIFDDALIDFLLALQHDSLIDLFRLCNDLFV